MAHTRWTPGPLALCLLVFLWSHALMQPVEACNTPKGGCKACDGALAYVRGVWKGVGPRPGQKGSGTFNLEGFEPPSSLHFAAATSADPKKVATKEECCRLCAKTPYCAYWQFMPSECKLPRPVTGQHCYLLKSTYRPVYRASLNNQASWIGGLCNGNPVITDDPHLVGGRGTEYDFSGQPGKSFCLVSDRDLHVNMLLDGYLDERTEGAEVLQDGKAVRTWIKEVGVLFRKDGVEHTLQMVARGGKQQERGAGFLARIVVDSEDVGIPHLHHNFEFESGLTITYVAEEKKGPYDVDYFRVTIPGLLGMDVRLRVAHPLLQKPEDAKVHFNLGFNDMEFTPEIHGVLGQTYRTDKGRVARAFKYSELDRVLGHNIAADGKSGEGFLDGKAEDYVSSSVLAPDCRYSSFKPDRSQAGEEVSVPPKIVADI